MYKEASYVTNGGFIIIKNPPPKPITGRQTFRLVQIETNCRRHFKGHLQRKMSAMLGRKHCEKRRNCLLQAISPFLTMFTTAIYLQCVKTNHGPLKVYWPERGPAWLSGEVFDS